jgi:hypothetical protein
MRLEWFREHHKRILLPVAVVVIPGMALFGAMGACERGTLLSGWGRSGPTASYFVNGVRKRVSAGELYQKRLGLWNCFRMGIRYDDKDSITPCTTKQASSHMALTQAAYDLGFDVGDKELAADVEGRVRAEAGLDEQAKVSRDLYVRFLTQKGVSAEIFEQLLREQGTQQRFARTWMNQLSADYGGLYLAFCREKREAVFYSKDFSAADYLNHVKENSPPTIEDLKKAYTKAVAEYEQDKKDAEEERKKDEKKSPALETPIPPELRNPDKLAADVLLLAYDVFRKTVTPTETELQSHYKANEAAHPDFEIKPAKPGEAKAFKPFNEVKDKVEALWWDAKKLEKTKARMEEIAAELKKEEAAAKEKNVAFDVSAFAAKHNLTHWRTATAGKDQFDGGQSKINEPLFKPIGGQYEKIVAQRNPDPEKGVGLAPYHMPEGMTLMRLAEYLPATVKTEEEALPIFRERLMRERANEAAKKAAEEMEKKWKEKKDLPAAPDYKELRQSPRMNQKKAQAGKTMPIAELFLGKPETPYSFLNPVVPNKAVGDILGPVQAELSEDKHRTVANLREASDVARDCELYGRLYFYQIGFAAAQYLPSLKEMEKSADWDVSVQMNGMRGKKYRATMGYDIFRRPIHTSQIETFLRKERAHLLDHDEMPDTPLRFHD